MNDEHRRPLVAFAIVTVACAVLVLSSARGQSLVATAQADAAHVVAGILLEPDATTPRAAASSAAPSAVEPDDEPEVERQVEPEVGPDDAPASPSERTREHAPRDHGRALGHTQVHGHGAALGHDQPQGHDKARGHGDKHHQH